MNYFLLLLFLVAPIMHIQSDYTGKPIVHDIGDYSVIAGAGIVACGLGLMGIDNLWVRYQVKKHVKLDQPDRTSFFDASLFDYDQDLISKEDFKNRYEDRKARWKKLTSAGAVIAAIGVSCLVADMFLDTIIGA